MQQEDQYKYFAFISYSSSDARWGKRLQRKLEGYRLPATLCLEHGWKRSPMNPVFYAPTDIQPGNLRNELENRLKDSRHLIVVCSPHSAKAQWVGWEISYFHSLGRMDNIHFFIVDGEPHGQNPERECFNPIIEELGIPEQMGANIHEHVSPWPWINRERAYVQLVSKMLGVEFDSLWHRHRRLMRQRSILWTLGSMAVLTALLGVWRINQPVEVCVALREVTPRNDRLPALKEAVVDITLSNEIKTDTIYSIDEQGRFANIPHAALGSDAHVTVSCPNWIPVDTIVELSQKITIDIRRDPLPYGNITFTLWNSDREEAKSGVEVLVAGITALSDSKGYVSVFVPLEKQDTVYYVRGSFPIKDSLLRMPLTNNSVVEVEN